MSHHYDPALEAELNHRRGTLLQGAEQHRLAWLAGRAGLPAATRITRPAWPGRGRARRELTGHARA